ncbi:peptide chain release factor N(5)-glutamine methyltransferase [Kistimonas asteriae]|uniref:peptide chain release factor N(5)-glutamine methyltransferase n=1 Tax=Kistimonas asteriae TaxID=517724 RepID=UPI001BAD700A|nr:peptide chain release factor N(5)-glutamine methyltransferase [Kistimonas asteriae]
MQVRDILQRARELTSLSSTPALDVELLLCHVLDKPRSWLFTWPEHELTTDQLAAVNQLIDRRLIGHPVAHLIGTRDFWNLTLNVSPDTLIPRPDTELLVEQALACLDPSPYKVADLGTGTGAIALALAVERPNWEVAGTDRVEAAVELARQNADMNALLHVQFYTGSWCDALPDKDYDLIVSNPPYIRTDDPHLHQGDVRFEPSSALASGIDGLDDIRIIAKQALQHLKPRGWLLLEHGYDQGDDVRNILTQQNYTDIETLRDLAGHERITRGRRFD